MPLGLETIPLRIADLLADPFLFAIPVYQRPYSWTLKEAGQLLDDVLAACGIDHPESAEPDYFLGVILLLSTAEQGPPRAVSLGSTRSSMVSSGWSLSPSWRARCATSRKPCRRRADRDGPLVLPAGAPASGRRSQFASNCVAASRRFWRAAF